jgi:hypothetical protein
MSRMLTTIGLISTLVYTIGIYILVHDRLPSLKALDLSLLGDFLAGVFGPIALLWLILGYLQQGLELRLNTKALDLQVAELRASVEHQRQLVEVSKRQFDVNLEVLRYERTQVELAMQPRLVLDQIGSQHHVPSGRTAFHFRIKNLGASIFNVSFNFSTPMRSVEPALLAEWPEGATQLIRFTYPEFGAVATELTVAYANRQGISGARTFRLVADLTGPHPRLTVVPPDL